MGGGSILIQLIKTLKMHLFTGLHVYLNADLALSLSVCLCLPLSRSSNTWFWINEILPKLLRVFGLLMLTNTKNKMFSIKMKMNGRVQPPVELLRLNHCHADTTLRMPPTHNLSVWMVEGREHQAKGSSVMPGYRIIKMLITVENVRHQK